MGEVIVFGVFTFVKVMILLFIISGGMGFFRTYLSEHRIKSILVFKEGLKGHFIASLLGAATPFSSKSFKLFSNFLEAGVPLGIIFSFLLTSPIINEYLIILMFVFFGWKITLIYLLAGLIMGTVIGLILSKINLDKYIKSKIKREEIFVDKKTHVKNRVKKGLQDGLSVIKEIWFLIFLGILLQVLIKIFVPGDSIDSLVEFLGIFGVPFAILLGTPFPGSGAAAIPFAMAFFEKGIPLGTTMAFIVSLVSLSLAKAREIGKYMNKKLIFIFFSLVIFMIMLIGYLLNYLLY